MCKYLFIVSLLLIGQSLLAHPMPGSVVNLSIGKDNIRGEAKMPLLELENALGMNADNNLNVNTAFFKSYFLQHIKASSEGNKWTTGISRIYTTKDIDSNIGDYREVIVHFTLAPQQGADLHKFTFRYDAIIHQVVTHRILVFVKDDWSNGIGAGEDAQQLGVIKTDFVNGTGYAPVEVSLEPGSWWKGVSKMVVLGMDHIREGTDHLLFLLVLLLPAMLLTNGRRWGSYGGAKFSLVRLVSITTAFTIGHSLTLLLGAMNWVQLPSQPVEILIAVSILVSAVHAIRPLFPGREMYVAAGFGLIHGLAFASVLYNMNLSASTMALSILGFNVGIELMQLAVIAITIPWLLLLSGTSLYKWVRNGGASLAAIAAMGWIAERSTGASNLITTGIAKAQLYMLPLLIGFAVFSIVIYLAGKLNGVRKRLGTLLWVHWEN